jgi:hypothetical protein
MQVSRNQLYIFFLLCVFAFSSCKTPDLSIPLNSGKFADDYLKNKRKSNRKYLYKEIILTGQLIEIYKNRSNETVLYISDNIKNKTVKCTLDKEKYSASEPLKLNMNLKIKGFCVGLYDEVEMKKCIILKE